MFTRTLLDPLPWEHGVVADAPRSRVRPDFPLEAPAEGVPISTQFRRPFVVRRFSRGQFARASHDMAALMRHHGHDFIPVVAAQFSR
jgi:hypothetical protein